LTHTLIRPSATFSRKREKGKIGEIYRVQLRPLLHSRNPYEAICSLREKDTLIRPSAIFSRKREKGKSWKF